jgi:hypothetical protein
MNLFLTALYPSRLEKITMLLAQAHQHHPQQIGKMLITISEKTHLGYYGILESGNKSILIIK